MPRVINVPRERDDVVLSWLAKRQAGHTWPQIATPLGLAANTVTNTCKVIRAADLAESGEPRSLVLAGYR